MMEMLVTLGMCTFIPKLAVLGKRFVMILMKKLKVNNSVVLSPSLMMMVILKIMEMVVTLLMFMLMPILVIIG